MRDNIRWLLITAFFTLVVTAGLIYAMNNGLLHTAHAPGPGD